MIELRDFALYEQCMIEQAAFAAGEDVYRKMASVRFNVPYDAVTAEMRESVKADSYWQRYSASYW